MPTSVLPKRCRQVGQESDELAAERADVDDDVIDEMGERGHILWIRGLSRLQHQVLYTKVMMINRINNRVHCKRRSSPLCRHSL